jgi:hypothetical protein
MRCSGWLRLPQLLWQQNVTAAWPASQVADAAAVVGAADAGALLVPGQATALPPLAALLAAATVPAAHISKAGSTQYYLDYLGK